MMSFGAQVLHGIVDSHRKETSIFWVNTWIVDSLEQLHFSISRLFCSLYIHNIIFHAKQYSNSPYWFDVRNVDVVISYETIYF